MNTDLRKEAKNDFEKDFFKLMNNSNHRDIKLVTTNVQRRKYVPEPDYMTSKCFSKDLMAIEMRKTEVLVNKPVCLGQSILDISKTLMYEFYYDYLKPKYGVKVKLCYMDTDSFIIHVQTEDFYKDIADDVCKWFDTSGYDKKLNRPLPTGINEKIIGIFKDESNGMPMIEFCVPPTQTYAYRFFFSTWVFFHEHSRFTGQQGKEEGIYLTPLYHFQPLHIHLDISRAITAGSSPLHIDIMMMKEIKEKKKAKGTKKCVIKNDLKFDDYKDSALKNKIILRSQQRFKSDHHNVFTEEINKVAISSNDDKRIQDFDGITTHAYGTPAIKLCESEILAKIKVKPITMYY